jgi:ATP-dependent exoDNAse (exonuclease V) beta subunit
MLARRLPAPRDLLGGQVKFTDEQADAIARRSGDLLLDAGAGSGKTSVLVERFVRAVLEDGVDVRAILTITFTEKAAAELRARIRARLRELGADDAARDTEGAWISTIHAFCARVLRAHALTAGLDPAFTVLEPHDADELSRLAFDGALAAAAATAAGAELIASHGPVALRESIVSLHGELRSRGLAPRLPEVADADLGELARVRAGAIAAAQAAARELGAIGDPPARVVQALTALERAAPALAVDALWPGDLAAVALPARNGAGALKSEACDRYRDALDALRELGSRGFAKRTRDALDALLADYAERYEASKLERSAVDFDDLELRARELLSRPEIGGPMRARFAHVMVDELQDTNRVQLELIDLVAAGNLFMVGDAQQSIYGFRHADVSLFEARGRELGERGARAALQTNFRSRPDILEPLNAAFEQALGESFRPLRAGRSDPRPDGPRVELLVVDKGADWESDGLAAPWRLAEARALAARVRSLLAGGECAVGEVVVLTRATTDLAAYERALEAAGVPTYVIGGRGYWSHPQVVELVAYLRALANPHDAEAYLATLASPLVGISLDGLVLFAAQARDELDADDRARLEAFETWFARERSAAPRLGVEELLDRALERTGYAEAVLTLPGGRRRLANVRKLMRLGREWEAARGTDLDGFVSRIGSGDGRESQAPVESEAIGAVRLMTIHRAKGLEFPCVCVADLGRGGTYRAPLVRVGDGGRLGLRLGRPGSGAKHYALDYEALRVERLAADEAEERRLFYVAMTRAQERLILSGAARMDTWEKGNRSTPVDWIVPAFIPDVAGRVGESVLESDLGVRLTFIREHDADMGTVDREPKPAPGQAGARAGAPLPAAPQAPRTWVGSLSYSGLAAYERCGYRFYAERVLGLPPAASEPGGDGALERGTQVHALLQRLDFSRPAVAPDTPAELAQLIAAFTDGELCGRLARATEVRREQRFAFALDELLITGVFDVLADEAGEHRLVVDYKTGGVAPYAVQRLIYAIAALRSGAEAVEVSYAFLDAGETTADTYSSADLQRLEQELRARVAGVRDGRFAVAHQPHRALCGGCPAVGGLCSWPAEIALRESPDTLF